jgi:pyrophosphate--fructose-6-phosphate 1-phosphotransferase
MNTSILQQLRLKFQPRLPQVLKDLPFLVEEPASKRPIESELASIFPRTKDQSLLYFHPAKEKKMFKPLKVGVVLSGGQAAGGHNVITGLYDALMQLNGHSRLFGFLHGPAGIIENRVVELNAEKIAPYRNMGGFDLIGSGRTKIETPEQYQAAVQVVQALDLDGLVIIGGDDSNTNAALLAEHFLGKSIKTRVIGVPKTIDGDLRNEDLEISFGFDTACKTYSEFIGNVQRDALSAGKYYFFIKVMGRSASHIALECALQTHPNMTLIGEEVQAEKQTIQKITESICQMIERRAQQGKEYGVIVVPEGLIEFIPECKVLIEELNGLKEMANVEAVQKHLSPTSLACFLSLPEAIQSQLLLDRDPHGNVKVSQIETERLFIETVKKELKKRKAQGSYKGSFSPQPLFCGYEGRSCFPSNFDANYGYALGQGAALLLSHEKTGYMVAAKKLARPVEEWEIVGLPLVPMMGFETRKGKRVPVIRKAYVDLTGKAFTQFAQNREAWMMTDQYRYPGPIQFEGPLELTDSIPLSLI